MLFLNQGRLCLSAVILCGAPRIVRLWAGAGFFKGKKFGGHPHQATGWRRPPGPADLLLSPHPVGGPGVNGVPGIFQVANFFQGEDRNSGGRRGVAIPLAG